MTDTADESAPNVRATRYLIVQSKILCLKCNVVTAVFTVAVPSDYESLVPAEDDESSATWESPGLPAVLSFIGYLPQTVANRLRALTPHYRIDLDKQTGENLWMNHCEHCGAQLDEQELHADLDGPFGPVPDQGLEAIQVHRVREPFEAIAAGESHDLKPLDS